MSDQSDAQFGMPGCTCIPWTPQGGTGRYLGPGDTVDKISGWKRGKDCPHHGQAPCTASITNEYSRGPHHCVLEAGHQDPEWGSDHAGPEDENGTRYRWNDKAIGAAPHQGETTPAPAALRDRYAAAIASYDHAVGQATDPAPGDHHYGQADAVLAVRDRELEQLRAQVERVRQLAERWENALAPDLAYARALRAALNPQETP